MKCEVEADKQNSHVLCDILAASFLRVSPWCAERPILPSKPPNVDGGRPCALEDQGVEELQRRERIEEFYAGDNLGHQLSGRSSVKPYL